MISGISNIGKISFTDNFSKLSLDYLNQCKMNNTKILKNSIFEHENIKEICTFLKENDIFMSIENCIIDSIDLSSLGNSICNSENLRKLHLNFFNYEWTSFASFSSIIAINESLEELDLSGNYLGDESSISLNEIILSNKSLQSLNLSHNNLSEASCKNIVTTIELNTSIQSLNLFGNFANAETMDKLASILVRNREYSSKFKPNEILKNMNIHDNFEFKFPQSLKHENKIPIIENKLGIISEMNIKPKENSFFKEKSSEKIQLNEDKSVITEENSYQIKKDNENLSNNINSLKNNIQNLEFQIEILNHNCLSLKEKNNNLEQSKVNAHKELEKSTSQIKDKISLHFFKEKANLIDEFTKKLQILKIDNEILSNKNMEINNALKKMQAHNAQLSEPLKEVTNLRQHNQNLAYTVDVLNKNLSIYQEGMNNSMQTLSKYQISQRNLEVENKNIANNVQNYIIPEILDKRSKVENLSKTLQEQANLSEYYKNLLSQEKLLSQSLTHELEEYKALCQSNQSIGIQNYLVDQVENSPLQYTNSQNNNNQIVPINSINPYLFINQSAPYIRNIDHQ